jgi:hypothetical protein
MQGGNRESMVLCAKELLPIPAREEGTELEVVCSSSTSGCGGMGGASYGMSLWLKLSRCERNKRGMPQSCSTTGSGDAEAAAMTALMNETYHYERHVL